jgi:hypothetical protein
MSELNEWFEDNQGQVNAYTQVAAIKQRNSLIEQQRENAAALRKQTAALEKQNQIESMRNHIEPSGWTLKRRREQAEHIKNLRNLIADISISLIRIRKKLPH